MSDLSPGKIEALVRLLADENPKVHRPAVQYLTDAGAAAVPWLERAERSSEEPRARLLARKVLDEHRRTVVLDEWVEFCERGEMSLERGALLVSRVERPRSDDVELLGEIDEFARVLRSRLAAVRTADAAVDRLVRFLADEIGFGGHDVDYADADNSYIHRVVEKRSGLPILLATVYLLVARRVGVPLRPVGMPRHFVLKYRASSGERFIDPFHGGERLSADDCRVYLERRFVSFQSNFLRGVSDREVLSRMLGNLLRIHQAKQDRPRLRRVLTMLRVLERAGHPTTSMPG